MITEVNNPVRTLMAQRRRRDTDVKIPRRKPNYPMSAERELARAYLSIAQKIRKESKPFIQRLMTIYGVWFDENVRTDARMSLQDGIAQILDEYGDALCTELIDATDITITTNNTSSFTITNGGAANVFILFMHYHDDEPTFP